MARFPVAESQLARRLVPNPVFREAKRTERGLGTHGAVRPYGSILIDRATHGGG